MHEHLLVRGTQFLDDGTDFLALCIPARVGGRKEDHSRKVVVFRGAA